MRRRAAPQWRRSRSPTTTSTRSARKTTINNSRDQAGQHARRHRLSGQKRYVVNGQDFYYRNAQHPGAPIKDVVQVFYQFKNEEKAGLGMPMPAGMVRVYQADSKGGVQFVGEDRIDHTPKDETLNLKIGNAFDVVCERKQIDFQKIAQQRLRVRVQITLRNHKSTPMTVEVNEPIGGSLAHAAVVAPVGRPRPWRRNSRCRYRRTAPTLTYRVRVTY